VQRLIATFTDAHRRYIDLKRTLDCVARAGGLPLTSWGGDDAWPELTGAASWKEALPKLETDADAPLPSGS